MRNAKKVTRFLARRAGSGRSNETRIADPEHRENAHINSGPKPHIRTTQPERAAFRFLGNQIGRGESEVSAEREVMGGLVGDFVEIG